MSEQKFMPGPWLSDYGSDKYTKWEIFTEQLDRICTLPNSRSAKHEANARLIAAAPDLYAACKAYYYGEKDDRKCERMMGEALAKAEGK